MRRRSPRCCSSSVSAGASWSSCWPSECSGSPPCSGCCPPPACRCSSRTRPRASRSIPSADPSGITYNLDQSITAVGSGGLTGRGVVEASQTKLDYLPEHATDFAFASLAEQRGFVGCAILLLLYLLVVWRGLRVITGATDLYGVVVAGGLVVGFLFQVFVNVGMTMGVAPVTGIPLPFVTVGGSSMVANLVLIGVLQSIHARGELGRSRLAVKRGRHSRARRRGSQPSARR